MNSHSHIQKQKTPLTVYEANLIAAVEEQWAVFLGKLDDNTIRLDNAEVECKKLIDTLRKDYKEEKIIKNSHYYTVMANDIIKAVKLDEAVSGAVHLGIAWCSLITQDKDYKKKALELFNKSLKILSNEMRMLNSMQLLLEQKQPTFTNSELYTQHTTKVTILGTYLNSIRCKSNIAAIKKSLRLIDLIKIKQQSNSNVLETIKFYYELERTSKNKLEIKMDKKTSYNLIFNDLTSREDSGTIDQTFITINNAYYKDKLPSSYNGIRIMSKQVQLDRIKAIFNQNKEYLDLTKESERRKYNTKNGRKKKGRAKIGRGELVPTKYGRYEKWSPRNMAARKYSRYEN
ncbi:unnamed protein product [Didymodactylos carnosus]|uniref:Uncharacterized protein n=1 Tax=Didymodactylos carnosus TaxID=1234261 RepID=A0A816DYP5_9BILA|nr:unnamed protein product [Didymodactylos carnosus]CAF4550416.1 unnamed protein product [Didymodactylos carnosus]